MKMHRTGLSLLILVLTLLASTCGTLQLNVEGGEDAPDLQASSSPTPAITPPPDETQPTSTGEDASSDAATRRYTFQEIGISLEVPADLHVIKEPLVSLDDPSKLESYLFYIQNYGYPGGPSSGNFQMYGHLQYNLPPISWEEFSSGQVDSPMNQYTDYIEVDGLRGYDTQLAGERNRFVYLFYLDPQVLSIAVSDPTPENKALADQIINSIQFDPDSVSNASHVVPVAEPNLLYRLLLPEDWTYSFNSSFNPATGYNISEFEARSPDFEVVVEEGAGHSDIYYKQGVLLTLIVDEGGPDIGVPYLDGIESQYSVYFNGVEGTEYIFVEPSIAEGKLREVRVHLNGKVYIMRFGYSLDADTDAIDRIIRSLTLQE